MIFTTLFWRRFVVEMIALMEFLVSIILNYLLVVNWVNYVMWKGILQTLLHLVLLFLHLFLLINATPLKLCGLMMNWMWICSCLILILFHLKIFMMLQLFLNFMITTCLLNLLVYLKFKLLLMLLSVSLFVLVLMFFNSLVLVLLLVRPFILALMSLLVKPLVLSLMLLLVKPLCLILDVATTTIKCDAFHVLNYDSPCANEFSTKP